jgi:superfamily II DNA/RNA helicase
MVAVRMVSEGVDVPRLAVGVYATSTATPLFFAQAIGRYVRARRRGETASIFLPSVPNLMALANQLEAERDHALDRPETGEEDAFALEDALMEAANREEKASDSLTKQKFEALESQASFDRVLFDGGEFGTGGEMGSEEEFDFLGIPGLLDADQVGQLLRQRQQEQQSRRKTRAAEPAAAEPLVADHRQLTELRGQLAKNVSAWSARTGTPHGVVHTELRKACGGPAVAQANEEQLQRRLKKLQDWFIGRK